MSTCPCDFLEKQNPFLREKRVVFDDSLDDDGERRHDYYIDGDKNNITSVTTLIHHNFQPFDADAIIAKILRGRRWKSDQQYRYYQRTKADILDEWEVNRVDASTRGTAMHLHIEQYLNNYPFKDDSVEFQQFLNFKNDYPNLTPFRTELVVFDEVYRIAGSLDMLYLDKDTGNLWIYDWKRSKEFKWSNKWQSGSGPLSHLDDCNIVLYSLQLNLYKRILETHYDVIVDGMCLVRCHPNLADYERVVVENMDAEIDSILDQRHKQLFPVESSASSPVRDGPPEGDDECAFSDSDEDKHDDCEMTYLFNQLDIAQSSSLPLNAQSSSPSGGPSRTGDDECAFSDSDED